MKRMLAAGMALLLGVLFGCRPTAEKGTVTVLGPAGVSTTVAYPTRCDNKTTTRTVSNTSASTFSAASTAVSDRPVTYRLYMTGTAPQFALMTAPKWEEIEIRTNVRLDVHIGTADTAHKQIQTAASSDKPYDIVYLPCDDLKTYDASLFLPLPETLLKTKTPHYYRLIERDAELNRYTVGGRMMGFVQYEKDHADIPLITAIRYDVLEEIGLSVPTTWREWFETMKQLKRHYPLSTPYSGRSCEELLDYWEQALGMRHGIHYDTNTNRFVCGVLQPEYRTVLTFLNDCYTEGILDKTFFVANDTLFSDRIADGRIFTWIDDGERVYEQIAASRQDIVIKPLPLMTNLFGEKTGYLHTRAEHYGNVYCLSAQAKSPDTLLRFMDWCYSEEGWLVNTFGRKGIDYKTDKNGTPYVPKSVWKSYASADTPRDTWRSVLGLGPSCFAPYYSYQNVLWEGETQLPTVYGQADAAYQADLQAGCYEPLLSVEPDISAQNLVRLHDLEQYIDENVILFIRNRRPLDEFDAFLTELKERGVQELLVSCNAHR